MTFDDSRLLAYALGEQLEDPAAVAEIEALLLQDDEARRFFLDARRVAEILSGRIPSRAMSPPFVPASGVFRLADSLPIPHQESTPVNFVSKVDPTLTATVRPFRRRPRMLIRAAAVFALGALAVLGAESFAGRGWFGARPVAPALVALADPPKAPEAVATAAAPAVSGSSPIVNTSFTLKDGVHRLPVLPQDPLNPFSKFGWFHPAPACVTERKFNPATRTLTFILTYDVSDAATEQLKGEIAKAYAANGRPVVTADQITIQPLQRVGYRVDLQAAGGDLLVRDYRGQINSGATTFLIDVPADRVGLIRHLTEDPDYVSILVTGLYDFGYSVSASTEATGLRSASTKVLQAMLGKPPTGPVILDSHGKQEYLARIRSEVVVVTHEAGLTAQPMAELALKQLGSQEPMTYRDFLDRPGELMTWNATTNRLESQPETYKRLTTGTTEYLKEETRIKSLSETISDLATHESDESKFYDRLRETMDLAAKASGGIPGIFSADLSMDLKKTYDKLSSGEKKAVADLKKFASNKAEFERNHLRESNKNFVGQHLIEGTTPKGFDLYRIADEAIVGETLFANRQVKLVDVRTVGIAEEVALKVEKPATIDPGPILIGAKLAYYGRPETVPANHLIADGREVRRGEYPELFRVIGTMHGRGDGSTTFNIPDLRGEFERNADDMGTARGARGVDGVRTVGSTQAGAFEDHSHDPRGLYCNTGHEHVVLDVYLIHGNAGPITNGDISGSSLHYAGHAMTAGYPYGQTRFNDGRGPHGEGAGPDQPKPFEGKYGPEPAGGQADDRPMNDLGKDARGNRLDRRMAKTSYAGDARQVVEGTTGQAITGSHAGETRPRNIAAIAIIRAR